MEREKDKNKEEMKRQEEGSCSVCEAEQLLNEQILGDLCHLAHFIIIQPHACTHTHTL